jgi:hypothetical protein
VDAALKNTSSSLLSTSSSLVDTSGTLQTISGSLVDTSGSLTGTTAPLSSIRRSLRDTSGVLVSINGRVRTINQTLRTAQSIESQGTAAIPPAVARISNEGLKGILADTNKVNSGLTDASNHLTSICRSAVASLLATEPKC